MSLVYPRDEGSYDPTDEEEPTVWTGVIPETYTSKLNGEKMVSVAVDLTE